MRLTGTPTETFKSAAMQWGTETEPAAKAAYIFMTDREIDIHTLPSMLTALRLPSFHKRWQEIASRADTEGWPATRFLTVLAEYELAERYMRRIRRHLTEAQLPTGKTLATLDF
jgi:DNA replication protein DnaC